MEERPVPVRRSEERENGYENGTCTGRRGYARHVHRRCSGCADGAGHHGRRHGRCFGGSSVRLQLQIPPDRADHPLQHTYCNDKRYASFRNLLRTGNLYSEDFCYHEVPEKLDPFDDKTFRESPMDYFVVCTDVRTGDPIYHKCRTGDAEDVRWMEASASMPLAAKIVKIGHYGLLDGGVADSIPIRFFESIGYKRNLIILTQPKGFVKKKNPMLPAIRARYLRYPAFVEAVADRHERYNETLSYISMLEQSGKDYVIRPPIPLEIGAMERDPDQLRRVYETGRAVAQIQVDKIRAFLETAKAEAEE